MKTFFLWLFLVFFFQMSIAQSAAGYADGISGNWLRMTPNGPVKMSIKTDGRVEMDFGNNGSMEVISGYNLHGDTITFNDREGYMCPEAGTYVMDTSNYYLAFDLVDDMCNGRVKMTMGFWTRPEFEKLLDDLTQKLGQAADPELNLTRARIYLATGNAADARADLDEYIRNDASNARAFVNRAGTRFPNDMEGVVSDCNRAIELAPENKNAWFLRGLAHYEMGNKEKACADFSRAIDLGFAILKIAEQQRCQEFWKNQE